MSSGIGALGETGAIGTNADGSTFAKQNNFGKSGWFKATIIASAGLSGGLSSSIAGGSFWAGARQGVIVATMNHLAHSGLNHAMHQGDSYEASTDPDPTDPPSVFQTALDGIGMTEIPILSQGAELWSAGISFANGDTTGGLIGLGSMIPLGGKAFEAMKVARFATKTISKLSDTKAALKQVHSKLGGSLPKGLPGKFGSPQRGTPLKGYRLDPGHPGRPFGHPESGPHINYWDYTSGNRGKGGISGAIPIK